MRFKTLQSVGLPRAQLRAIIGTDQDHRVAAQLVIGLNELKEFGKLFIHFFEHGEIKFPFVVGLLDPFIRGPEGTVDIVGP